jgi:hypothetical protein
MPVSLEIADGARAAGEDRVDLGEQALFGARAAPEGSLIPVTREHANPIGARRDDGCVEIGDRRRRCALGIDGYHTWRKGGFSAVLSCQGARRRRRLVVEHLPRGAEIAAR